MALTIEFSKRSTSQLSHGARHGVIQFPDVVAAL